MTTKSLYSVLNIPDYSDIGSIKKSFRHLALLYHPDRNSDPQASEIFKSILDAYEILSDSELKISYDKRLKNGFDFQVPYPNTETERENKRKHYAKMRAERMVLQEFEQITDYENSLKTISLVWRLTLLGLLFATGILNIVSDWFIKGHKIAIGFILLAFATLFIWNELYKYFWHKSLTKIETTYYNKSSSWFFALLLFGIFSTTGLIFLKKTWHLNRFPAYVYAKIDTHETQLTFTYKESNYAIDLYKIPEKYRNSKVVLIRISSHEPQIWEFVAD